MGAGNALARVCKYTDSSEIWLHVAYVINFCLTYKIIINYNGPVLLIIMFVWIIMDKPI